MIYFSLEAVGWPGNYYVAQAGLAQAGFPPTSPSPPVQLPV